MLSPSRFGAGRDTVQRIHLIRGDGVGGGGIYPTFESGGIIPQLFGRRGLKNSTKISNLYFFLKKVPYHPKGASFNNFLQAPDIEKMRQIALTFFKNVPQNITSCCSEGEGW